MFDREKFGRILIPMVTPFGEDQSVSYDKAAALAEFLVEKRRGDSLVLSGTTGEFFTMSVDERSRLFETVKERVGGRIPLIAGIGCASTVETIELGRRAERLGFDTAMVVAPYYTKPNQHELYNHFARISEALNLDLMVYNIPIFTGVNVDPETVGRLAEFRNVVAIKEEAELNPKQITAFLNATPEEFIVYNGDDTMILEAFAQGGPRRIGGVISGASHVVGDMIRGMIESFLAGKIEEAAATQRRLYPLLKIMGQNGRTNPVSLWKSAMRLVGMDAGLPRLPLSAGTDEEVAAVRRVMSALCLL